MVTYIFSNEDDGGYVASDRGQFDGWCLKKGLQPSYLILVFLAEI